MNKRLKLFISAYACEPEKGSEPGIGWNVVNELAKYHEVHVLTRSNNQTSIENALAEKKDNLPIFHYYDLPKYLSFWKKKRRGYHLYYYLWQYGAFFKYRKFVNTYGFDIVQHLTFANYAMPSLFMFTKPVTVWGPIGVIPVPKAVKKALPLRIRIKENLRAMAIWLLSHLDLARYFTPVAANWIIEYAENSQSCFPKSLQHKVLKHSQTGINTSELEYQVERQRLDDGKIRLLICSEFIHWKGVTFSAEIFSRLAQKHANIELHIYGSGPEKPNMKNIFHKYNVDNRVVWHGFVKKQEMIQALFNSDILLYPSYHHGLATVILQAMYAKLPIVTIFGDPIAIALSKGGGLVATGNSFKEIMDDFEEKTDSLIISNELRKQIGNSGAKLIANHYEWQILVQKLSNLSAEIMEKHK